MNIPYQRCLSQVPNNNLQLVDVCPILRRRYSVHVVNKSLDVLVDTSFELWDAFVGWFTTCPTLTRFLNAAFSACCPCSVWIKSLCCCWCRVLSSTAARAVARGCQGSRLLKPVLGRLCWQLVSNSTLLKLEKSLVVAIYYFPDERLPFLLLASM